MSATTLRFFNRGSNVFTTGPASVSLLVPFHLPVETTVVLRVDGRSGSWRVDAANERNGAVVQHPRTMNPIDNPYLAVRARARKVLQGMRWIKAAWLWEGK